MLSLTIKDSFFFEPIYTLRNYQNIFSFYQFDFQNTFTLVGLAALLGILFGYPFAYFMVRKVKRFGDVFRCFMLVPLFGEMYIAYGLWFTFLPTGPLGFVLESLGIPATTILYSPSSAIFALAVYTFPFVVFNVGISLQEIDPSLEDAAKCLGAGPLQAFFRITLPLSLPGIVSGWLSSIGWNLGSYAIPQLLGGAVVGQRVLSVKVYSIGLIMLDFGLAAALGVILVILGIIIFYLSTKITGGALV